MAQQKDNQSVSDLRPPIVAVLGHVDHGKTTLLDVIRKSDVVSREHGGITQHIGAYQIAVASQKERKGIPQYITFIDTPGHEAFEAMRQRGATVSDVALLVVAGDDSVKPQTIESIKQIVSAKIPMIVVVTKIDKPEVNIEKVKSDLAKNGIQVEGFGGNTPIISVSAKNGTGIKELLDLILLVWEMSGNYSTSDEKFSGFVIETRLDRGKGPVATVIVKKGHLSSGMLLYDGQKKLAKVRCLFDEYGKTVMTAYPSKPVEIIGFSELPIIGSLITSEPELTDIQAQENIQSKSMVPDFLKPVETEKEILKLLIKADTSGTLQAIIDKLDDRIIISGKGVGSVSEADILHAKSTSSIVIGFNVRFDSQVQKLAYQEKVIVKIYNIIYELLEDMEEVLSGLKELLSGERELGKAEIIAEFPFSGEKVAGVKVLEGRIARGDSVKLMRDNEEIYRTKIKSIRHGKEIISKSEKGNECGILFDKNIDFLIGDVIILFAMS